LVKDTGYSKTSSKTVADATALEEVFKYNGNIKKVTIQLGFSK